MGILDWACATCSQTLAVANHELGVRKTRPMVMIDVLRGGGGGVVMMAISGMIHDSRGRGGEGGANRSGERRRGMEPQPWVLLCTRFPGHRRVISYAVACAAWMIL